MHATGFFRGNLVTPPSPTKSGRIAVNSSDNDDCNIMLRLLNSLSIEECVYREWKVKYARCLQLYATMATQPGASYQLTSQADQLFEELQHQVDLSLMSDAERRDEYLRRYQILLEKEDKRIHDKAFEEVTTFEQVHSDVVKPFEFRVRFTEERQELDG
jgi:hypothetical protein